MPRRNHFATPRRYQRLRGAPRLDGSTTEFRNQSPTLSMVSDDGFTVLGRFRLADDNADAQGGVCEANTTTGFWRLDVFRPGFEGVLFADFRVNSNNASNRTFTDTSPTSWHVLAGNLQTDGFGRVYIDGATTGNVTAQVPPGTIIEPTDIRVGAHITFGPSFDGDIRDVAICYPGLTEQQIIDAQDLQDWRQLPNVVRLWTLHNPDVPALRPAGDDSLPSLLPEYIGGVDHMTPTGLSLADWNTKESPYE